MIKIVHVDRRGLGVVAAQDIVVGTRVIKETPLVRYNDEQDLIRAIHELDAYEMEEYMSLASAREKDGIPKQISIAMTNAASLGSGEECSGAAVFKTIARINHSCAPNCQYSWNSVSETG